MPFAAIYRLGTVMGNIDLILSGKRRIQKMSRNISSAFNDSNANVKGIIKRNLQNHIINVLEFIKYPQLNRKNISQILSLEGLEYLDKELSKGNGVILVTAHFGAKQMLQVGLGLAGYKITQINYHMSEDELSFIQKEVSQKHRKRIEEKIPAEFVSSDGFMRSAFKCLKDNRILIIAGDGIGIAGHMKKGYAPMDFLGNPTLFPSNITGLAKRTGASIVPAFVVREQRKHKIVIHPSIDNIKESDNDIMNDYITILEEYIRTFPHLWEFWEEFEEGILIAPPDDNSPN